MKKKKLLHIPAVAVGTDYTCIPFWEETDLDYYVIPHEDLIPEYVKRGVPEEKLLPLWHSGAAGFCRNLSKEAARKTAPPDGCSDVSRHERKYGIGKLAVFAAGVSTPLPERRTHCDHLWK